MPESSDDDGDWDMGAEQYNGARSDDSDGGHGPDGRAPQWNTNHGIYRQQRDGVNVRYHPKLNGMSSTLSLDRQSLTFVAK